MAWTTPITWATGFANRATAAIMNQQVRDNLNYLYRTPVRRTTSQSVTSSTAFVNDDTLLIPLAASEKYLFECQLFYDGSTAGDIKVAWTVPSGATGGWGVLGSDVTTVTSVNVASFAAFGDANTTSLGCQGSGTVVNALIQGTVVNSTNAGNLQLRWAQATSSGTSTRTLTYSYIIAWRYT